MPSITLSAGQIGDPIEVGPGTRVTAVGGYVQWTTGSMVDARNGVATWQNWPAGAVAATEDTLRRVVIRAVATGAMTLTWDESKQDAGADGAYWQEQVPAWATDANGNAALTAADGGAAGIPVVSAAGMTVRVSPFTAGQWSFAGGSISVPSDGTWFVGVEVWSGVLRCLPRLGHRGWVPVARVVAAGGAITTVHQIAPQMPATRIPRALKKMNDGVPVNVVIMGSSLAQSSGSATDWPGMVFGSGSQARYRLPGTINTQYRGVPSSPNQYQLAQLGFASRHTSAGSTNAGWSTAVEPKFTLPSGRSAMLNGVDLVVITLLANGGDYRLETIEPIVRQLRRRGIEVVLLTDNPQNPTTSYTSLSAAPLYVDGPEVIRIADLYGVEIADTAAYVFDAHLRSGGVGIYNDTIHMTSGTPSGVSAALPANGHEAWARAVRSIFSIRYNPPASVVTTNAYDFSSNFNDWAPWFTASLALSSGRLVATISGSSSGVWVTIPGVLNAGDVVTFTVDVVAMTGAFVVGLQTPGSWASNVENVSLGSGQQFTFTANRTTADLRVLFACLAASGSITIDNVTVRGERFGSPTFSNAAPDRAAEARPLPPVRMVTDMRTPADAFVILPTDEAAFAGGTDPDRGALAAHPWGPGSIARCWSSAIGASQDLLTLATSKRAILSAPAAVGYALIHYREPSDGVCTVEVRVNGVTQKTINISAVPFANEWFLSIYTPTELNSAAGATLASGSPWDTISLHVTSGTLRVAALIALSADIDYVSPDQVSYVGSWLARENSRSGLPGRPTDTNGAYAYIRNTGNRVAWILSSNPGTKLCEVGSGTDYVTSLNYLGNNNVVRSAPTLGPGEMHYVRCIEANASGSQSNGRALHVGGAYIINDR